MDWLSLDAATMWWIAVLSIAMFVGSLLAVPMIVVRIPADYFVREHRVPPETSRAKRALRLFGRILKNLVGAVLIVVGFVMLFTPGQGIITMLVGLSFMDIPGKKRLILMLVSRPSVYRWINSLREKRGKPPLELPPKKEKNPDPEQAE
jgi:archaellum biogenesis protein FlaJ (TadC family)